MKARRTLYIALILLSLPTIIIQTQQENLIPNPSFEQYSGVPLGWFYNGSQFSRLIKYWYSPTQASPDAFGPDIVVPSHWRKKGFGVQRPHDGSTMVGITMYGCADGKPHCKEYVQAPLQESMVIGQKYKVSFWVASLQDAVYIDKVGALFSKEPIKLEKDGLIEMKPQFRYDRIMQFPKGHWRKMEGEIVADSNYNFITIGNFSPDSDNDVNDKDAKYKFAYYYIDKVTLTKSPPIIQENDKESSLVEHPIEVGHTIQLKNIYFDLDKSNLLPRSFVELNKLRKLLLQYPTMTIEVHGHTDIQGESSYNLELSRQRAQAVTHYLIDTGIANDRIDYKGYGSTIPIASNEAEEGRQLNRRVEILITGL